METTSQQEQETPATQADAKMNENDNGNESELELLQKEAAEAKAKASEYLDGWQRARADFVNYKKRQDQLNADLRVFATMDVIKRLLPIADDFERAARNKPVEFDGNSWVDGVMLVHRKLTQALDAEGVKPIVVKLGEAFDPNLHEAVTHDDAPEGSGIESGHVIEELQKGYKVGERIIRPALVRVAK